MPPCFKLFGNSWGYSHAKFTIIDIKCRFARGESKLNRNTKNCQNNFAILEIPKSFSRDERELYFISRNFEVPCTPTTKLSPKENMQRNTISLFKIDRKQWICNDCPYRLCKVFVPNLTYGSYLGTTYDFTNVFMIHLTVRYMSNNNNRRTLRTCGSSYVKQ